MRVTSLRSPLVSKSKISVIPMPDYTSDNKQVGDEDKQLK
jgi:hypothetical protein